MVEIHPLQTSAMSVSNMYMNINIKYSVGIDLSHLEFHISFTSEKYFASKLNVYWVNKHSINQAHV